MIRLHFVFLFGCISSHVLAAPAPTAAMKATDIPASETPFKVADKVLAVLDNFCFSCHDADEQKGKIRLDNLSSLTPDARLDLLNQALEQLYFGEMPPKKKEQPSETERKLLIDWVGKELRSHNADKLADKLRMPDYGNVVDHNQLFSGQFKGLPGSTNDRRWLISEFIFDAKINKILDYKPSRSITGLQRPIVIGDNTRVGITANLANPFLLPTNSGVRYYDTTIIDGGHLLTMLTNARELSAYMISRAKKRGYLPAVEQILATDWKHQDILAARETYLQANIEQELTALFKEKHTSMLPKFVPKPYTPPAPAMGPDGMPLKKTVFDSAKPSKEEREVIYASIRRHSSEGQKGAALIAKCEQDWFVFGASERTILSRLSFMHGYLEEILASMPKPEPKQTKLKPPAEAELAIIRAALQRHRNQDDTYAAVIKKCMNEWAEGFKQERLKAGPVSDPPLAELVQQIFIKFIERPQSEPEKTKYLSLARSYLETLGAEKGIEKLIQTIMLRSDFVYRSEFGEGKADEHGRRMLSPRDASYALSYALTDSSPDKTLAEAAQSGRLNTREDYKREVERMLKVRDQYYIIDESVEKIGVTDSFTNLPIRKLRFFREFFGYPAMLPIFKDNKRFGGDYANTVGRIVGEADMLVEYILKKDQNVFERLLTTEEFYVFHSGDNAAMKESAEHVRKLYDYFKDKDCQNFDLEKLKEHLPFLKETPIRGLKSEPENWNRDTLKQFKRAVVTYTERFSKGPKTAVPFLAFSGFGESEARSRTGKQLRGPEVLKCFNLDLINWDYPTEQPTKIPNRKGILTHPAWLIAFAGNTATDPVRRGKWVREKLLAGTIMDVPVTVDAVVPEDHANTLRGRLAKVSEAQYCWKCHERMNPLGYPFEIYDDFGRFRTQESLEYPVNLIKAHPKEGPPEADMRDLFKTLPIDARGRLVGSGDPRLDGDVKDALDLIDRLGKSTRVRQSIIRHAFRFFLGRNEVLSDSKTLIDADLAYLQSGGSFDAVIVSLLTSDSFIYRKSANP